MGGEILFGGAGSLLNDLWVWQGDWQQITASGGPGPRWRHAAAMDVYYYNYNKLLVFGGQDGEGNFLGETWILDFWSDPPQWRQVTTDPSPPARADGALVSLYYWDGSSWREEALLFGGQGGDGSWLGDTWIFDFASETWTQVTGTQAPAPRAGHSLGTVGGTTEVAVLFGGQGDSGLLGDTWMFDAVQRTWTSLSVSGPPPRRDHAVSAAWLPPELGWDEAMYLFGGQDAGASPLGDTWAFVRRWDTTMEWQLLALDPSPPARAGHVMSSGPVGYGSSQSYGPLLFGGRDGTGKLGDTWILDLGTAPS